MSEEDVQRLRIRVDNEDAKRRMRDFGATTESVAKSGARSVSGLTDQFMLLRAGLAGLAIGATVGQLDRLFAKMDDISDQSRAFEFFAGKVGLAADTIKRMGEAAGREVTNMQLMQVANDALALELVNTTDELVRLTAAAHSAGEALGVDSKAAMDIFTRAAGRVSDRALVQLGVILDLEAEYDAWAKSVGKTAAEMTEAEKRTVFMTAALRELEGVAKSVGGASDTLSAKWIAASTSIWNAWSGLLEDLNNLPAVMSGKFVPPGPPTGGLPSSGVFFPPTFPKSGPALPGTGAIGPGGAGLSPEELRAFQARSAREMVGATPFDFEARGAPAPFPMEDFRKFPAEISAPDFDALIAEAEKAADEQVRIAEEREAAELGAQERLMAARLAAAEEFSVEQQLIETTALQERHAREIEAMEATGAETAALKDAQELELTQIEDEYARQREERAQKEAKFKRDQQLMVAQAALTALGAIFPKSKPIQYALAIINTARAVTEALPDIPLAALVAAAGLAQIVTIASTSAGGGGSVTAPSGGASIPDTGGIQPAGGAVPGGSGGGGGKTEVHIFIEGAAFVQDIDAFSREIVRSIERQQGRAGEA